MQFSEWEPVYIEILKDLGFDRASDEASARLLKVLTLNSDLISEDDLRPVIGNEVIVAGGNLSEKDMAVLKQMRSDKRTALISAGSATDVLMRNGVVPDITVTDLDGDAELQKKASSMGSITLIHAHGDNSGLISEHVKDFTGKIMITTQSSPDLTLCNFGGLTDGDRAVCTARHLGADLITLIGFDLDTPAEKKGTDMQLKKKKLGWAKKVIFSMNTEGVEIRVL